MTVIQVCSAPDMGGGEVHVADLCRRLTEHGVTTHLVHRPGAAVASAATDARIGKHPVAPRNALDLPAIFRLARLIAAERADIVHAHMGRDWFPVAVAVKLARARGARARLVLTRHLCNRIGWNPIKRYAFGDDCRVVAVSGAVEQSLWDSADFFRNKTTLIPNWLGDTPPERRNHRAAAESPEKISVACIGTITPNKDQLTFVRAAKILKSQSVGEKLRFTVIGGAGNRISDKAYERRIKTEAGDTVDFPGRIAGMSGRMGEHDIVVVPSLSEAFALTLIEAMDSGCAVVASDVGGMLEILDTPDIGRLFPVCDEHALASLIQILTDNPGLREALGVKAAETVRARYAPEKIIPRIIDFYEGAHANQQRRQAPRQGKASG